MDVKAAFLNDEMDDYDEEEVTANRNDQVPYPKNMHMNHTSMVSPNMKNSMMNSMSSLQNPMTQTQAMSMKKMRNNTSLQGNQFLGVSGGGGFDLMSTTSKRSMIPIEQLME